MGWLTQQFQKRFGKKNTASLEENFAALMLAAKDDYEFATYLLAIVSLVREEREVMIENWVEQCDEDRVPPNLREAMRCLMNDQIALKTQQLLLRYHSEQLLADNQEILH